MADEYAPLPGGYAPDWALKNKLPDSAATTPPASAGSYAPIPEGYKPQWGVETKAPSIFAQAAEKAEKYLGAPSAPLPAEKYLTMPWGEYGSRALRAAPRNLAKVAESTVESFMPENLPETLMGIGQMGYGLASKGLGAVGLGGAPEQRKKDESVIDAVLQNLKENYGSKAALEKSFAERPAETLADIGGGLTLGAAPMTSLPGKAGTIARAVKTAGELASPATIPIKAAEAVAPVVPFFAKSTLSGLSGLSKRTIEDFYQGGKDLNIGLFKKALTEEPDPQAAVTKLNDAMRAMRDEREQNYLNTRAGLQNQSVPLSFQNVDDAMTRVRDIAFSGPNNIVKNKEAAAAYQEIMDKINEFKKPTSPLGGHDNMIAFDALKQAIDDIGYQYRSPKAKELVKEARNAAKQTIVDHDPEYARLMDEYSEASQRIADIESELGGVEARGKTGRTLRKLVSTQKSAFGKPLLEEVEKKAPGIRDQLAALEVAQSKVPMMNAMISGVLGNMWQPGYGALTGVLAEPRVAATMTGLMGGLAAPAEALTKAAVPTVAASRLVEPVFSKKRPIEISRATGGRINRGMNAQMLIAAVERAKENGQKATESILEQPDEHVVRALKVANANI